MGTGQQIFAGIWKPILVLCLAPAAPLLAAEPEPVGELTEAIARLSAVGQIGTDAAFDEYKRENHITAAFVAPAGLRSLIQPPDIETASREHLSFGWKEGRISLMWTGDLRVAGDRREAEEKLTAKLQAAGFRKTKSKLTVLLPRYESIEKRLLENEEEYNLRRSNQYWPLAFYRDAEGGREEVLVESLSELTGGRREMCGGDFAWCISCDYVDGPPTLAELLAAFPALTPVHIDEGLNAVLQTSPVHNFSIDCTMHAGNVINLGWGLLTSADIRDDFEAVLTERGFVPDEEVELPQSDPHPARTSFRWSRMSDFTYASIVASDTRPELISVSCQAPQRRM